MLGLCDLDIHPQHLADQYIAEDRRVMHKWSPAAEPDLARTRQGEELKWFISSKIPLFDARGRVIGIAGVMRDLEKAESLIRPYREMDEAIAYVLRHYAEPIEVARLADLTHLSVSQFDRRFKRLYQMTPMQYVLRVRINAACQALTTSDRSIAEIAVVAASTTKAISPSSSASNSPKPPLNTGSVTRRPNRSKTAMRFGLGRIIGRSIQNGSSSYPDGLRRSSTHPGR